MVKHLPLKMKGNLKLQRQSLISVSVPQALCVIIEGTAPTSIKLTEAPWSPQTIFFSLENNNH